MLSADTVVIGGGSTGTSAAFQLALRLGSPRLRSGQAGQARRGRSKIILVERETVGSGPTSKSIGIIRLHYSYEPLIRLAARSLEFFSHFEDLTGGVADFTRSGFLLLASPEQMPSVRANVDLQRALGVPASVLAVGEIAGLDARMNLEGVGGAAYEPDSGYADGYATAASFAAAARRLGVEVWEMTTAEQILVEDAHVRGVRTSQGVIETPTVLVAAGPWTPILLRPLGIQVPIDSSRQQVVQLAPPPAFGGLQLVIEDMTQGFYARPEAGETVLAGVLEEEAEELVQPDAFNRGVDFDFMERVGRMWARRYPVAAEAEVRRGYASLYDVTPDWQPVLGAVDAISGLYVAAGFSGHGFKLSPALGEVLAALISGESPPVDIGLFHLSRFGTGKLLRGRHVQGILG